MVLKHHGAVGARLTHFAAVEDHAAFGGVVETGNDVEHCRFAAAAVADDADELALVDLQVHLLQGAERPFVGGEGDADAGQLQVCTCHLRLLFRSVASVYPAGAGQNAAQKKEPSLYHRVR